MFGKEEYLTVFIVSYGNNVGGSFVEGVACASGGRGDCYKETGEFG